MSGNFVSASKISSAFSKRTSWISSVSVWLC